jgi:hypothetical protein
MLLKLLLVVSNKVSNGVKKLDYCLGEVGVGLGEVIGEREKGRKSASLRVWSRYGRGVSRSYEANVYTTPNSDRPLMVVLRLERNA